MNFENILNKAKQLCTYEKINSGIHDFTISKIELSQTEKSKKNCIRYKGTILNSSKVAQEVSVTELCDTETSTSFAIANLIRLYQSVTKNEVQLGKLESLKDLEELVDFIDQDMLNKVVRLEFIKKQLPDGKYITTKELSAK